MADKLVSLVFLAGGKVKLNTAAILMKNVKLQGINVGSSEMFEDVNRAIALKKFF